MLQNRTIFSPRTAKFRHAKGLPLTLSETLRASTTATPFTFKMAGDNGHQRHLTGSVAETIEISRIEAVIGYQRNDYLHVKSTSCKSSCYRVGV